jgi:hypothetical protein
LLGGRHDGRRQQAGSADQYGAADLHRRMLFNLSSAR